MLHNRIKRPPHPHPPINFLQLLSWYQVKWKVRLTTCDPGTQTCWTRLVYKGKRDSLKMSENKFAFSFQLICSENIAVEQKWAEVVLFNQMYRGAKELQDSHKSSVAANAATLWVTFTNTQRHKQSIQAFFHWVGKNCLIPILPILIVINRSQ